MKRKGLYLLLLLSLLASSCSGGSSADGDNTVPLVGHWSFMQLTVNHPNSTMYSISPSLCAGDLDIYEDGTYHGWNRCKRADQADRVMEEWTGTWVRMSQYHYRANDDYDVFLSKEGTVGMFASTATDGNLKGHYEYGHMFKDVSFDHALVGK
jgi:hypothetical protein